MLVLTVTHGWSFSYAAMSVPSSRPKLPQYATVRVTGVLSTVSSGVAEGDVAAGSLEEQAESRSAEAVPTASTVAVRDRVHFIVESPLVNAAPPRWDALVTVAPRKTFRRAV